MIDIDFDTTLIEREMARVRRVPYAVQRVLYPAVSEVTQASREFLAKRLVAEVALPDKVVARSVKVAFVRAQGEGVRGRISVASKALPLIHYDVQPAEVTARKGIRNINWPGFSYALRAGQRRQREELEGLENMRGLPFIAAMHNRGKGGHLGVFRRTSAGQIKELYGPRVQYHATTPETEAALIAKADADMSRILPRHAARVLAEFGTVTGSGTGGAS